MHSFIVELFSYLTKKSSYNIILYYLPVIEWMTNISFIVNDRHFREELADGAVIIIFFFKCHSNNRQTICY